VAQELPYSESCERNKRPILKVLQREFSDVGHVLEIGSGTGQHAEFFASDLAHLEWQPTELAEHLAPLERRLSHCTALNLLPPIALGVADEVWATAPVDAIFTANTLHIMSWPNVELFFAGAGRSLGAPGVLAVYGPFRYAQQPTSSSNEAFDAMPPAACAISRRWTRWLARLVYGFMMITPCRRTIIC
jgi:Protein of unknown function (DUF938)